MHQLNEFCQKYLPQHFVSKYKDCKLKEHFFDYTIYGNVFELTGKNFLLIDKLLSANPELQASKIIDKYFVFTIMEFKKFRKEIKEIADQKGEQCQTRQTIRRILKSMDEVIFSLCQNHRMCFQLFIRICYFYFKCREDQINTSQSKKEQNQRKNEDYFDEILTFYMDIKFLTMTEDDSFNPSSFMEYCIMMLLDFNPNKEFFQLITNILNECSVSEVHKIRIMEKIDNIKKIKNIFEISNHKIEVSSNKQPSPSEASVLEPKKQNTPQENYIKPNQSTPKKQRSTSKSELKTHETSQKKLNIIQNKEDPKREDRNSLQSLKMTLQNQMSKKISYKERTIYSRKTYLMPKKACKINDQVSTTASNPNINSDQLFLIDFNKSFSSRCLNVHFDDDEDFLAGATPKPKKKVKIEKTYTQIFDENGRFVPDF